MDLTALILITIPAMLFGAYLRDVAANRGRDEEIYKKKCPECDKYSYSASKVGFWECAYCGNKIDEVKAEVTKGDGDNVRK